MNFSIAFPFRKFSSSDLVFSWSPLGRNQSALMLRVERKRRVQSSLLFAYWRTELKMKQELK
jgi:hypothetical protein